MKSGDAVMLRLAGRFGVPGAQPAHDLTFVFYDNEEVEAAKNGLGRVARERRGWLYGDLAVLLEPHRRRDRGRLPGHAAGRARPRRAGARTAPAAGSASTRSTAPPASLATLAGYRPREVDIDGCTLPRGAQRRRHRGRRGRQRDPRRVPR